MRSAMTSAKKIRLNGIKRISSPLSQVRQLEKNAISQPVNFKILRQYELSPSMLHEAKRLHAKIYLERTYIDPEDVNQDGVMHLLSDPHQKHSDYFVVTEVGNESKVMATARQIRADRDLKQLPIFEKSRLYAKSRKYLSSLNSQDVVEISGLAKDHGVSSAIVLELYLVMWGESMSSGHQVWLMACDVRLYRRLKILFGSSIVRIGKRTHYKGGDVVPCKLELKQSHKRLLRNLNNKHPIYGRARRSIAQKFLSNYSETTK